jgi:D-serine deaminase-like pyridoxal phosphate-dependent protein
MKVSHMHIDALSTPALIVDTVRIRANITRWQSHAAQYGVALRPHIKTHKTIEIARMQQAAGAHGITAAKLSEAECFVDAGWQDVFVAYPIIGIDKCRHAARLAKKCRLIVAVDSVVGVTQLATVAADAQVVIYVRIEVDSGLHRCGVQPDDVMRLVEIISGASYLQLDGLFTYRGAWFSNANGRSPVELGREEGELLVQVADFVRQNGVSVDSVSVGSTPTGMAAATVPGVTEIRPGTYVFGDDMQIFAQSCTPSQVALSILCTVVSRPDVQTATIDAGAKTFSGDVNYERMGLTGYATAVDYDATLVRMSEEHGVLKLAPGVDLPIGARIAMRPIHVCTTVNLSDELYLHDSLTGDCIPIPIVARGKRW